MALIRGMSSPVMGTVFEIEEDAVTIGRGSENLFCVADPSVSTHHCVIEREDERYTLRDVGSTNGTRLNGNVVKVARLKPKDIFQVGSVDLMFDGINVDIENVPGAAAAGRPVSETKPEVEVRQSNATPLSSAFGKKRDHRRMISAIVYLIAGLALAALIVFVLMLLRVWE